MRNEWYSDKRDLVKWSVLLLLAKKRFGADRVLQVAYYRPSKFGSIEVDGHRHEIPNEVLSHFRDLRNIALLTSRPRITVFDPVFEDRVSYAQSVKDLIASFSRERCIVFLDPDTGLEPRGGSGPQHVLNEEACSIWQVLPAGWLLVFYQHQTNKKGQPWVEAKKIQLANAIGLPPAGVKVASGLKIASDVVFFFARKPNASLNPDEPHDTGRVNQGAP